MRWTCPFCDHKVFIDKANYYESVSTLLIENKHGRRQLTTAWIVCPNDTCKEYSLFTILHAQVWSPQATKWLQGELLQTWPLVPQSSAKVFPEYVPLGVREDYNEACAIRNLSPKASATLARRCLQGMIRNFYGVSKRTLFDEIEAIKDKVDPMTWASIDATRKIGNIGAHMEKDINVIVDVDSKEAQVLINLIEILIKDWYINRHDREEMLKSVVSIAEEKTEMKKAKPTE
ncbi:DUF4145 domain-containing protein [Pontibacter actiniarum]|uniref:DUF4145 domain-containing protein n=1 Tax=Pontibacter actiniarum TaxID=323450 RepID=A0A1X9YUC9_9BACT|nr:DUF4145 domain-containing protein [Pontibacter actiniarum]ARS36463.1 hypothetical protein CA264_14030 [Pontibacter actiniarum]